MAHIRIGVACPIPGERATFLEWLAVASYEPVPMLDLDSLPHDLSARPIQALIADVTLLKNNLTHIVHILGPNRPLVVVGNPGSALESVPRDATWIERPVTIDRLLLALQLALAEGRPARRSPRKPLSKVLSSVEGAAAKVVDLSTEGLRLEFGGPAPPALGPFFTLQVPSFGLTTRIKRVWVSAPTHGHLWCGGMLDRVLSKKNSWEYFLETAPSTAEIQFTETKGV